MPLRTYMPWWTRACPCRSTAFGVSTCQGRNAVSFSFLHHPPCLQAQPLLDHRGKVQDSLRSQLLCLLVSLQEAGAGQQLGCDPPRSATVSSSHCTPNHEGKRLKVRKREEEDAWEHCVALLLF